MKNIFYRYKYAVIRAHQNEPDKSYFQIFIEKINWNIRRKYDSFRSKILKDSTFVEAEDLYMCSLFPVKVIDEILKEFRPNSVLDVGCGTGVSLQYFFDKGLDALGVENSMLAIRKSAVREKIVRHNLKKRLDLKRKFDLVWSFEVIEHIHPKFESIYLDTLIRHSDRVIISAARPGQGGHGHFNEQFPEYWISKFLYLQFHLNHEMTDRLRNITENHSDNLLVFEKRASNPMAEFCIPVVLELPLK